MPALADTPAEIRFFAPDGLYGWLCALSPHPIRLDDMIWPTAEHYYQALKFAAFPALQAEIAATPDPLAAKAIAKREKHRRPADWKETLALPAFRQACQFKFGQNPALAAALLATGDAILIEANPDDACWGSGPDGNGLNWVGRILMEIRDNLNAN